MAHLLTLMFTTLVALEDPTRAQLSVPGIVPEESSNGRELCHRVRVSKYSS